MSSTFFRRFLTVGLCVCAAVSLQGSSTRTEQAWLANPDSFSGAGNSGVTRHTDSMPAGLAPIVMAARQRDAGPGYAIAPGTPRGTGPVVFHAANRINQLHFTFTSDEIQVSDEGERQANPLRLQVTRFGSQGHAVALATATPVVSGNRVEYTREGPAGLPALTEWYVNGPLGLEQGFTIERDPSDDGARSDGQSTLVFETRVTAGWTPVLSADGSDVLIADGQQRQLHYGHLSASDARGRLLPSAIAVDGQNIELQVDARGAEYPLTVDPLLQQILTANDRAKGDYFGYDIAISGDTALVGAPYDNGNAVDQGSAYVFVRSGTTWIQQAKLTASDGAGGDAFGSAVSLSGNTAVIGAPDRSFSSGAVYVFVRSGTAWTQQAMLLEDADKYWAFSRFGQSLDVDGDTILVGLYAYDPGVYVFVRTGSTWTKQARLPTTNNGGVAIQGNTAVIGHGHDDKFTQYFGYVFVRTGSSWSEQARLSPKVRVPLNGGVDISGDTVVFGSVVTTASGAGASVFVRSGTTWAEQAMLIPTDAQPVSDLGAVVLEGDTAVLSATFTNPDFAGTNQGAAYAFVRKNGIWTQQSKLTVKNITPNRDHAYALALNGNTALLGSPDYDAQFGGAFVFLVDSNAPPTITAVSAKTTPINTPIAVNLSVDDAENGPSSVIVSASAANTTLVPNAGLVFSGTGAARTLTISPALNLTGTTLITITATDGTAATTTSFALRVGQRPSAADFDGDGKTDIPIFRPSNGTWYLRYSAQAYTTSGAFQWGFPGDIPIAGDFDGDARIDLTVFRPSNGTWYVRYSALDYSTSGAFQWGFPGDVPIAADFDGDGRADLAVWRPSNGTWYVRYSATGYGLATVGAFQWGLPGDLPLATDFDGDGRADLAVWRPSNGTWYVRTSSTGYSLAATAAFQWGLSGDLPMVGDFDGDGKTELAVWRPSNGTWYIRYSSLAYSFGSAAAFQWGLPGDVPATTDFDGDAKADLAVWRASNGTWYVRYSSLGYGPGGPPAFQWGLPGDVTIR